jgi:hypothetical protein
LVDTSDFIGGYDQDGINNFLIENQALTNGSVLFRQEIVHGRILFHFFNWNILFHNGRSLNEIGCF